MRYKSDVCLDILAVLAYGPQPVINSAAQILLHYYPLKDVGMVDPHLFLSPKFITCRELSDSFKNDRDSLGDYCQKC